MFLREVGVDRAAVDKTAEACWETATTFKAVAAMAIEAAVAVPVYRLFYTGSLILLGITISNIKVVGQLYHSQNFLKLTCLTWTCGLSFIKRLYI